MTCKAWQKIIWPLREKLIARLLVKFMRLFEGVELTVGPGGTFNTFYSAWRQTNSSFTEETGYTLRHFGDLRLIGIENKKIFLQDKKKRS